MQGVKIRNDLFSPSNVKCFAVNNYASNSRQRNFMNSVQNVRHTLKCLERSINKSNEYEQRLLRCKGSHRHSHGATDWWSTDHSDETTFKCSNTTTLTLLEGVVVDLAEDDRTSWIKLTTRGLLWLWTEPLGNHWERPLPSSGMMQANSNSSKSTTWVIINRYEELAKRYRALIQAYDEQCYAVGMRDKRLAKWRQRVNSTQAHLTIAHTALLSVGEKYLALNHKRKVQKKWYEEQLVGMRQSLQDMMDSTTRARLKFDARLVKCMASENDSDAALLLHEIRKCNLLFLENMQLKAIIEELIPGQIKWKP